MENWIRENFEIHSKIDENEKKTEYFKAMKNFAIPLDFFLNNFRGCNLTLDSFKNADNDNTIGYYNIFEKWREDGLID